MLDIIVSVHSLHCCRGTFCCLRGQQFESFPHGGNGCDFHSLTCFIQASQLTYLPGAQDNLRKNIRPQIFSIPLLEEKTVKHVIFYSFLQCDLVVIQGRQRRKVCFQGKWRDIQMSCRTLGYNIGLGQELCVHTALSRAIENYL